MSCISNNGEVKNSLIGDWRLINNKYDSFPYNQLYRPFGIGFRKDEVEYYNGFIKYEKDSVTGKFKLNYQGNFTQYQNHNDSIYVYNPFEKKWNFVWKIKAIRNDTLFFLRKDSTPGMYKRIKYDLDTILNFDQIIFSSTMCYGSCPVIDISVKNNNEVFFMGKDYVEPLGLYKSTIDSTLTKYIFEKFKRANPSNLKNNYSATHSDDQTITVDFLRNGKVVKTIEDYGYAAPKELIWAYVPIRYLYTQIKLEPLSGDRAFFQDLNFYGFRKDSLIANIQQSFFFLTELQKAKKSKETISFTENYELLFIGEIVEITPTSKRKNHYIENITTDGRFYKFYIKDSKPIIYDLGYNFVQKNFTNKDFIKRKTIQELFGL